MGRIVNRVLGKFGLKLIYISHKKRKESKVKRDGFSKSYTKSGLSPDQLKVSVRTQAYFQTLDLDGVIVEAGVGEGFGLGFWLKLQDFFGDKREVWAIDSFSGFSQPHAFDNLNEKRIRYLNDKYGKYSQDYVKGYLRNIQSSPSSIKRTTFIEGYVPAIFSTLPDARIALLNLDFDLYEPIKASLEYFWDKMEVGGIILLDEYDHDFDQEKWRGAKIAIDDFCKTNSTELQRGFGDRAFLRK